MTVLIGKNMSSTTGQIELVSGVLQRQHNKGFVGFFTFPPSQKLPLLLCVLLGKSFTGLRVSATTTATQKLRNKRNMPKYQYQKHVQSHLIFLLC